MALRALSAPLMVGVLLLGSSISAVSAADAPAFTPMAAPAADPTLPRFEPAEFVSEPVVQAIEEDAAAVEEEAHAIAGGVASWYGNEFAGHKTASGERFNPADLTAAHRTLPFGTRVRVSRGDRSVVVRINDRGPFARGRVIDLSKAAAEQLGLTRAGSGAVELALLDR